MWGPVSGSGAEWHPLWLFTELATPAGEVAQVGTGEPVAGVACSRYGVCGVGPTGHRTGPGMAIRFMSGSETMVLCVA